MVTRVLERLGRARLAGFEKAWAEAIFAAILAPESAGLPPWQSIDRSVFWRCLEHAPGLLMGHGLRAMIHAMTFLPLTDRRYRRPFFALSREAQETLVEELANDPRHTVAQLVTTLKMLACFAYFDDATVRAHVAGIGA